jgi:hypothetical protein
MSQQQHTLPPLSEQLQAVINEGWEQEILPQLPTDYEQQAEHFKAFVRPGEIKQVADLLRALLAYVLCAPSFRQLGAWAVLVGLANISHVAWRKRLRQARPWLLWLLCELLAPPGSPIEQPREPHAARPAHRCHPPQRARRLWRRLAGASGL